MNCLLIYFFSSIILFQMHMSLYYYVANFYQAENFRAFFKVRNERGWRGEERVLVKYIHQYED